MKLHSAPHLPENLARPDGFPWGTTLLSFVQVGYGEEARHAARRTFMPPSEGGGIGGQNDVAMATTFAYRKHKTAGFCLEASLALLAVSASQALWAEDRKAPPKLRGFLDEFREVVPPLQTRKGRDLGKEVGRLRERFGVMSGAGG